MTEPFIRQRRNLIIVCMVITAMCLGQLEIANFSFAGMKFGAFKNPEIFYIGSWICLFYFLYRFLVFFRSDCLETLKMIWHKEFEASINPKIEAQVRATYQFPNPRYEFWYHRARQEDYSWFGQINLEDPQTSGHDPKTEMVRLQFRRSRMLWWEIIAALRFFCFTAATTEFFLPVVLAVFVTAYCGFLADWAGNISSICA